MVLALIAVVAIVVAVVVVAGDDSGGDDDEVVLEPIGQVQANDFAGNLDLEPPTSGAEPGLGGTPEMAARSATSLSGQVADGGTPGLYGGSRDAAVCNIDQLVGFLTSPENADKAEAWAGVLGIGAEEIERYVGGLTAVRLRFDTRVTNHGFRDGEADPFQSLLQAGTAVLVDDHGVPRVKCNCGNPLAEPEPLGDATATAQPIDEVAQNPENDWGIDTSAVVSIEPAAGPVTGFTVVNVSDGAFFERPVGSNGDSDADPTNVSQVCQQLPESPSCGGTGSEALDLGGGNVQVTLRWDSNADLDLHVIEPDGTEIWWSESGPTASGGQLDKDSNVFCDLDGAVENVFWPEASPAPAGDYVIEVHGYAVGDPSGCGGGDYTLSIRVEGQDERVETGSVAEDEVDSYDVTVGA